MGKFKLEIKKLENLSGRQITYSKRKNGILKKAYELSVLCDIDLLLIMFSPGGKPSLCSGKHSIEEVVARFNQLPSQERTKRKVEGLEALKKTFKKLDHDVNIQDFLGTSTPTIKVCMDSRILTDEVARIQSRLAQVHERLGCWTNPDRVSDLELLMQMEDLLGKSIEQIQRQKLPFHLSDEQSLQQLLWAPSDHIQHVILTQEPKSPAEREIESCTGSSSVSYFGCPSTSSKSEADSPGQLSGIDNVGHDAFHGLQFEGQYQYLQHGLNMQGGNNNLQAMLGMDQQQGTLTYHVGTDYQPTVPWHDFSNRLPPESPADSALGEYLNYQVAQVRTWTPKLTRYGHADTAGQNI